MRLPPLAAVRWLLLLAAGAACAACAPGEESALVRVERRDLPLTVEAAGALRAIESASVFPPRIKDVWEVKIARLGPDGGQVHEGEPVAVFDASELMRQLESKAQERDQAAKEMEKQEIELETRLLDLDQRLAEARARARREALKVDVPQALASRAELQKARLDLEAAEGEARSLAEQRRAAEAAGSVQAEILRQRRDRAEGRVRELQVGIQRMTVVAPRAGLLLIEADHRGAKRKVGDAVSAFDKVLEIPDLSRMRGEAQVDEADGGRVAVGQRVTVSLEAHPGIEFPGVIGEIGSAVRAESWRSSVKVFRLQVDLDRTDPERMRPGMRFRAEIEVGRVVRALVLPLEAVRLTPSGPIVMLREGRRLREVPVELGARNATDVEIRSGLSQGDTVARHGAVEAPAGEAG
jgi:RND family efflux transporter MFP subunit